MFDAALAATGRALAGRELVWLLSEPGLGVRVTAEQVVNRAAELIVPDDRDLRIIDTHAKWAALLDIDTDYSHSPTTYEARCWER